MSGAPKQEKTQDDGMSWQVIMPNPRHAGRYIYIHDPVADRDVAEIRNDQLGERYARLIVEAVNAHASLVAQIQRKDEALRMAKAALDLNFMYRPGASADQALWAKFTAANAAREKALKALANLVDACDADRSREKAVANASMAEICEAAQKGKA